MTHSRRQLLAGAAALAASALPGCRHNAPRTASAQALPDLEATGSGSLREHAAAAGLLYGCAVDIGWLQRDPAYAALVRGQAAILVAERTMEWASLRPAPDRFDFDDADALVAFAEQNRMKLRGQSLCWHRQLPAWFIACATPANAAGLLREHIETVVGRYAGRMHSWDVVKEAVLPSDNRPDGLRNSPWLTLIGEDYIEQAFRAARQADPQALLAYTDNGLEAEDEPSRRQRAAVLLLLRRMKARRVPVDAVGIQAHLCAGATYGAGLREFLAQVRTLDLQILLTELDVDSRGRPADETSRDAAAAATYASFLDLCLADPAVRVVLTSGITDRKTGLNPGAASPGQLPARGLPFGLMQGVGDAPKPAFFSLRNSFDRRRRV